MAEVDRLLNTTIPALQQGQRLLRRWGRRAPSKAPFYELEDVTKDLTYALEDQTRHGQKMPLIVLMDNGSTEEDVPAMRQAQVYGMEMLVVDHHHPHKIERISAQSDS